MSRVTGKLTVVNNLNSNIRIRYVLQDDSRITEMISCRAFVSLELFT